MQGIVTISISECAESEHSQGVEALRRCINGKKGLCIFSQIIPVLALECATRASKQAAILSLLFFVAAMVTDVVVFLRYEGIKGIVLIDGKSNLLQLFS